ncbi:MAG: hypothetical protein ABIQ04_04555 [Candidatus Saccharimonadales bacterium]
MSTDLLDKFPVDVCYMVADLKYSATQGVKICEIQQASLSLFNGDAYRNPLEDSIHTELLSVLSTYNKNGWILSDGMADKNLIDVLARSPSWKNPKDLIQLFSDVTFREKSKQSTKNSHDISSYQGFLYTSWSQLSVITDFETRIPGMVVMDKSSFPFWIDKYLMTDLFTGDEMLSTLKPKWGNYKKAYTKNLASKIASDLQCDTFVIKPRGEFMGKGVIIVTLPELDKVLHYIITKKGILADIEDAAYSAWQNDTFDSFIVEEFVTSDLIKLPHLENRSYQPTMRVAFLLTYNKYKHGVHFLGEYWKTPKVSVDDEGDFMEKNKDICEPPYYLAVSPETTHIVHDSLRTSLPLLHAKMMSYANSQPQFYEPESNKKVQLVLQEKQVR